MLGLNSKQNTINSFEVVTLQTSGMRHTAVYEIVIKDNEAEISQYGIRFTQTKNERVPERRAVTSTNEILQLLNRCKILSWDGFHGKHPRGVLDGTMFSFAATVNGDRKVRAEGSQNFPKHYREFTDALYEILSSGEKL